MHAAGAADALWVAADAGAVDAAAAGKIEFTFLEEREILMKGPAQAHTPGLCESSAESIPKQSSPKFLKHPSFYQIRGLHLSADFSVPSLLRTKTVRNGSYDLVSVELRR